jgi:hypothetical protein
MAENALGRTAKASVVSPLQSLADFPDVRFKKSITISDDKSQCGQQFFIRHDEACAREQIVQQRDGLWT